VSGVRYMLQYTRKRIANNYNNNNNNTHIERVYIGHNAAGRRVVLFIRRLYQMRA